MFAIGGHQTRHGATGCDRTAPIGRLSVSPRTFPRVIAATLRISEKRVGESRWTTVFFSSFFPPIDNVPDALESNKNVNRAVECIALMDRPYKTQRNSTEKGEADEILKNEKERKRKTHRSA